MPLEGAPIDIELTTTNQLTPTPGKGPQGRLTALVNANVRRYIPGGRDANANDIGTKIRTDKREGFSTLKNQFFATSQQTPVPTNTVGTSVVGDASGNALALIDGQPNVYIPAVGKYGAYPYNVAEQRLTEEVTYSQNSISFAPDHSHVSDRTMTVWIEKGNKTSGSVVSVNASGFHMLVSDDTGGIIVAPVQVDGSARRVRTVTDGTYFWVVFDDGTGFTAQVYDNNGTHIDDEGWTVPDPTCLLSWDIVNFPGVGVVVAYSNNSAGVVQLQKLTTNGSVITRAASTITVAASFTVNMLCTFLRSDTTGRVYLAIAGQAGGPTSPVNAYSLNSSLAISHTFAILQYDDGSDRVGATSGYSVGAAGAETIIVAVTFLPLSPQIPDPADPRYIDLFNLYVTTGSAFQQCDAWVKCASMTFGGTGKTIHLTRGAVVASRAFLIGDQNYCVLYSPDPTSAQPTWLFQSFRGTGNLANSLEFQRIAGEFDFGAAYAPYLCYFKSDSDPDVPTPNRFHVPSVFIDILNRTRFPLSYRNENVFQAVTRALSNRSGPLHFGVGPTQEQTEATLSTVGIKTWSLKAGFCESVRVGDMLLLPGAIGNLFNDQPTELGLTLAPQVLNVDTVAAGSVTGKHEWIAVWEWTDADGNFWRSPPSLGVKNTDANAGGTHTYTVQGRCLYATNKLNLRAALYRDTNVGGVESIQHYKLVSDLAPVINKDDGTAVFSFDDNVSDANIANNEVLYTDQGLLPRYPAPSFHAGTVWQNRPCLIGHDNAIWIGGAINPGDGLWWNPALRVTIPNDEFINSIRVMDSYLVIFCDRSIWYCPETTLPDSTGQNGSLPTPIKLPFANGGTGPSVTIREGVMYASSAGGVWLLTRGLTNLWIGEEFQDSLAGTITSMQVDQNQRVFATVQETAKLCVFDVVSRVWGEYFLPVSLADAVTGIVNGHLHVALGEVWQLGNGLTYDFNSNTTTKFYIAQQATIAPIRLNGIENYKRTWGILWSGETHSICGATISLSYPDGDAATQTVFPTFDPSGGTKFPIELRAKRQLSAAYALQIIETQSDNTVFGAGFSLTALTFYVGLEKGPNKLPAASKRFS